MFLAQSKVIGNQLAGDLVRPTPHVALQAPLMEALAIMVRERLITLTVFSEGTLVGMLRDKNLLPEIMGCMGGTTTDQRAR